MPPTPAQIHEPEGRVELRRLIEEIVTVEQPVHRERVLHGVLTAWGRERAGARIREAFDRAVAELSPRTLRADNRGFLSHPTNATVAVRVEFASLMWPHWVPFR